MPKYKIKEAVVVAQYDCSITGMSSFNTFVLPCKVDKNDKIVETYHLTPSGRLVKNKDIVVGYNATKVTTEIRPLSKKLVKEWDKQITEHESNLLKVQDFYDKMEETLNETQTKGSNSRNSTRKS